ncbi:MAG: hypothetical protein WCG05_05265 [Alphaproteobacteria bacterium]
MTSTFNSLQRVTLELIRVLQEAPPAPQARPAAAAPADGEPEAAVRATPAPAGFDYVAKTPTLREIADCYKAHKDWGKYIKKADTALGTALKEGKIEKPFRDLYNLVASAGARNIDDLCPPEPVKSIKKKK